MMSLSPTRSDATRSTALVLVGILLLVAAVAVAGHGTYTSYQDHTPQVQEDMAAEIEQQIAEQQRDMMQEMDTVTDREGDGERVSSEQHVQYQDGVASVHHDVDGDPDHIDRDVTVRDDDVVTHQQVYDRNRHDGIYTRGKDRKPADRHIPYPPDRDRPTIVNETVPDPDDIDENVTDDGDVPPDENVTVNDTDDLLPNNDEPVPDENDVPPDDEIENDVDDPEDPAVEPDPRFITPEGGAPLVRPEQPPAETVPPEEPVEDPCRGILGTIRCLIADIFGAIRELVRGITRIGPV